MHDHVDATASALQYATRRRRWLGEPYVLAVLTAPAAYLVLYVVLRATGVFYAYYSQGSWEIETTGIYAIDMTFIPLVVIEGDLHNRLRWLPEPTGG